MTTQVLAEITGPRSMRLVYDQTAGTTGFAAIPIPPGSVMVGYQARSTNGNDVAPVLRNAQSTLTDDGSVELVVTQDATQPKRAGLLNVAVDFSHLDTLYCYGTPSGPTDVVRHDVRIRW